MEQQIQQIMQRFGFSRQQAEQYIAKGGTTFDGKKTTYIVIGVFVAAIIAFLIYKNS